MIIGNPPYVEYKNVREYYQLYGYKTESCGDLYAFTMERTRTLSGHFSGIGMIIPVSIVSTDSFRPLRDLFTCKDNVSWALSFAERPSKLFNGVEKRLTIWLSHRRSNANRLFVSKYRRWLSEERDYLTKLKDVLFTQISFVEETVNSNLIKSVVPKISTSVELSILERLKSNQPLNTFFQRTSSNIVYYTRKVRYFVQFFDFVPQIMDNQSKVLEPSELKELYLDNQVQRDMVIALLNSNLFFWFFNVFSDVRNVNRREIEAFRCSINLIHEDLVSSLLNLKNRLMEDFKGNSKYLTNNYGKFGILTIQSFQPRLSKPIIDEIDRVLAKHYGFTDEELDFIINYDIKYRMGRDGGDEGEE